MANTLEVFKKISTPEELAQEANISKEGIAPFEGELIFKTEKEWKKFLIDLGKRNIDEIIREKINASQESVRRESALKQNMLIEQISWLNIQKSYELQKEAYNTFEDHLFFAIQRILIVPENQREIAQVVETPLTTGKMREQIILENPEKIAQFLEKKDFPYLEAKQQGAIKKFQEIVANKDSELYAKLLENWKQETALIIESIRQSNAFIEEKEAQDNPIMWFIKEHPLISTGIAAWWIALIWNLFSSGDEKEKSKKDDGNIFSSLLKWGLWIGWAILWLNLLSWFLSSERVQSMIKNTIGWDVGKFWEALSLVKEWKFWEAVNLLFISANWKLKDEEITVIQKNLSLKRKKWEQEFDFNVVKGLCVLDAKSFIYWNFQDTVGRVFSSFTKGANYVEQEDEIRKILRQRVKKDDIKEGEKLEDVLQRYFWGSVGTKPQEHEPLNDTDHPDWVESFSWGLLHIWAKGTKFTINGYLLQHVINQAILNIDRAGLNMAGKQQERNILERFLKIIQKEGADLSDWDKKFLNKIVPEFISKHPDKFPDIEIAPKYLKDWEKLDYTTRRNVENTLISIKEKTDNYLSQAKEYTKEKKKLVQEAQRNIKKEKSPNVRKILRDKLQQKLKEIDDKIADLNKNTTDELLAHEGTINKLYENLNPTIKQKGHIKESIQEKLKNVWVSIRNSKLIRRSVGAFKIGFIGITTWTLLLDETTWKWNLWETAWKLALEIAPWTSEWFDFKAAITGIDIRWKSLDLKERAFHTWFWIFWLAIDGLSLLSLWQSQWWRLVLAFLRISKLIQITQDITLVTKLVSILERMKIPEPIIKWFVSLIPWAEEFLKFTKKVAHPGMAVLTVASLWVSIYEGTWDIMEWWKELVRKSSTWAARILGN